MWRTEDGTSADFELVTYWYTWAAVRRFAGDDLDRAVLYPGDEDFDLDPALRVEHRELAPDRGLPVWQPSPCAGEVPAPGR